MAKVLKECYNGSKRRVALSKIAWEPSIDAFLTLQQLASLSRMKPTLLFRMLGFDFHDEIESDAIEGICRYHITPRAFKLLSGEREEMPMEDRAPVVETVSFPVGTATFRKNYQPAAYYDSSTLTVAFVVNTSSGPGAEAGKCYYEALNSGEFYSKPKVLLLKNKQEYFVAGGAYIRKARPFNALLEANSLPLLVEVMDKKSLQVLELVNQQLMRQNEKVAIQEVTKDDALYHAVIEMHRRLRLS